MLKLQNFGHLMWRTDSLEKTLMLGKAEGRRRRGRQRMRWLDGFTDSMDMSLSKLQSWCWTGMPGVLQSMGLQRVGCDWVTELNWLISGIWTLYYPPCSRYTFPSPFSSASMIYYHDLIALSLSMTEKSQIPVNSAFKYSVPHLGNGCSWIKSTRLCTFMMSLWSPWFPPHQNPPGCFPASSSVAFTQQLSQTFIFFVELFTIKNAKWLIFCLSMMEFNLHASRGLSYS